jgi:hypothetical protein
VSRGTIETLMVSLHDSGEIENFVAIRPAVATRGCNPSTLEPNMDMCALHTQASGPCFVAGPARFGVYGSIVTMAVVALLLGFVVGYLYARWTATEDRRVIHIKHGPESGNVDESKIFMTKFGKRFHTRRGCHHLQHDREVHHVSMCSACKKSRLGERYTAEAQDVDEYDERMWAEQEELAREDHENSLPQHAGFHD